MPAGTTGILSKILILPHSDLLLYVIVIILILRNFNKHNI